MKYLDKTAVAVALLSFSCCSLSVGAREYIHTERIHYQGSNNIYSVPSDLSTLSEMRNDDQDYRPLSRRRDVRPTSVAASRIELGTAADKTTPVVLAGSRLAIHLESNIDGSLCKVGDEVRGSIIHDFIAQKTLIAPAGSAIIGHIAEMPLEDTTNVKAKRRSHPLPSIKIVFDTLQAPKDKRYALTAIPAVTTPIKRGSGLDKVPPITINNAGAVILNDPDADRTKILRMTTAGCGLAADPIGLDGGPELTGTMGLAKPVYRPSDDAEKEARKRAKRFEIGTIGVHPGGYIFAGKPAHTREVMLRTGDTIVLELQNDFVVPSSTES